MLRLGKREFGDHDGVVMAIVDRTPGADEDPAGLSRVALAVSEGARIVDVGEVDAGSGRDVRRAAAFVAAVRERHPEVVIGVRTGRHEVAEEVCAAGADLIHDAWGGADPRLAQVAARHGSGLVCGYPAGREPGAMTDILRVTADLARRAADAGVRPDGILVDPGPGLGGRTPRALETTRRLAELVAAGRPVLVSLPEPDFTGTAATAALAAWLGARVHRVRAVAQARQVLDMVASIAGHRPPAVALRGLG